MAISDSTAHVPPALESWPFLNCDMADGGELHGCASGRVAVFSARAPHKDSPNQDSAALFCFGNGAGVLVVADGMGGMPRGARASALVIDAIHSALAALPDSEGRLREALFKGIDEANLRISALGVGAGSTLAAVEINNNIIRSYHVGDSSIVVVGRGGKIKLQTVSHSPVGYAIEAGVLDENDALHHEERNIVSNLVGSSHMRVEVGPVRSLDPYDTVLLASDGLFDNLYMEEIVETIRKGPLEEAMQSLIRQCRTRMEQPDTTHPSKSDDMTFMLYRVREKVRK